jgi:phage shock protein E
MTRIITRVVTRPPPRTRLRAGHPVVAAVAALALGLACAEAASEPTMTGDELASRLAAGEAPLVLDVRTPEEFATGRIPGAINIPHTELSARLDELGPDARERELVVYCRSGARAAVAEAILRDADFSNVRHLEGDMTAWRGEERPCEAC